MSDRRAQGLIPPRRSWGTREATVTVDLTLTASGTPFGASHKRIPGDRCRRFKGNAARVPLFALADNLANFLRELVLPSRIRGRTLTTLREKLIRIGAKVVAHVLYVISQLAEAAVPRQLFAQIPERIACL